MADALVGAEFAKATDCNRLLFLFGLLMVPVGLAMLRRRDGIGDPAVRLSTNTVRELLLLLLGIGLVFCLSSSGWRRIPHRAGLNVRDRHAAHIAIGTSLVAVAAFVSRQAASYAASGLIDRRIAALFSLGGVMGGAIGVALSRVLERVSAFAL